MLPRRAVLAISLVVSLVGIGWGLPGSESWAADAASPRGAGLGAIVETYISGHHHIYPPLHMLFLTVLALPVIVWGVATAGTSPAALEAALIQVGPMTIVEVLSRLLAVAMTLGIVHFTMRLHEDPRNPRSAPLAGLAAATVAPLAYYGKVGNLDVPALFWGVACLAELGCLLRDGAARDPRRAVLCATAAVLTKDQIAGVLVLPLLVVAVQWAREKRLLARPVFRSAGLGLGAFVVLSGALLNPTGYAARLRELFGPASRSWEAYPRTAAGSQALLRDLLLAVPRLSSWPMFALALGGIALVAARRGPSAALGGRAAPWAWRLSGLLPALGALSFTLTFTLGARRTEDRFLLAQAVLLFPYAGAALAELFARLRPVGFVAAAYAFGASAIGVASVDATLLVDSRYAAERYLEALPAGTSVEVYGGPKFLPRLPDKLATTRVGTDPPEGRSHLPHVTEVLDPDMRPDGRRPEIIVLSTEFSHPFGDAAPAPLHGVRAYMDPPSFRFFRELTAENLQYTRVLDAGCKVPWPLSCRPIHGSTGGAVWIYKARR